MAIDRCFCIPRIVYTTLSNACESRVEKRMIGYKERRDKARKAKASKATLGGENTPGGREAMRGGGGGDREPSSKWTLSPYNSNGIFDRGRTCEHPEKEWGRWWLGGWAGLSSMALLSQPLALLVRVWVYAYVPCTFIRTFRGWMGQVPQNGGHKGLLRAS